MSGFKLNVSMFKYNFLQYSSDNLKGKENPGMSKNKKVNQFTVSELPLFKSRVSWALTQ